jgi:hypothetical protein
MSNKLPPKIRKFSPVKQRRLDQLLLKNAEGTISDSDKSKLKALVDEAESVMMANSSELAKFARTQSKAPTAAVPVTVWVNPGVVERN